MDYDVGEAFQRIEDEMIASMSRNLKRHLSKEKEEGLNYSMWQAEQLKALNEFKKNNAEAFKDYFGIVNEQFGKILEKCNQSGQLEQEAKILEAIQEGWDAPSVSTKGIQGSFFKINERKMNALINATKKDMAKAETAMLRQANDVYRKTIFNAQVYYNSGAGTLSQCVDMATKDFLAKGITCVEYANGAMVGIDSYARMVLRTTQTRAYLMGEAVKRDEWGINTVIVNKRGTACPFCMQWVGQVYYDDVWGNVPVPSPEKYKRLSVAIKGGLYHPNCRDMHSTYFEGISTPPTPTTKAQIDEANRVYRLEQRQRYNERQIRKYKRLVAGSIDDENVIKYSQKLSQWQELQKNFIEENGDVLKRRAELEKVFELPENLQWGQNNFDFSQDINDIINNKLCKDGHTWIEEIITPPTCEEKGEKIRKCAVCGEEGEKIEIPPIGHKWVEVSITPPTCTKKGERLLRCENCGEEKTEEIPATGHQFGTPYIVAPTCTQEGYTFKKCTVCGHIEKYDIKPALDHDWGDWVITRQPTTALAGRKQAVCKRCGTKKYGTVPKLKAPSPAQQIKALEDSIKQLDADIAALDQNTYTGIWKDVVTPSDYPYKKAGIPGKKQYFLDKINAGDTSKDWQKFLDLVDEYETKGKEYENLLAQKQNSQNALNLLKPQPAKANPFTPDAYGKRKTDAWSNRFKSDRDADKYYRPIYDKQCSTLTDENKFGIWQYTHNSHPMNRPLSGYDGQWGSRSYFKGHGKLRWSNENNNFDAKLTSPTFKKKFANAKSIYGDIRDYKDTIADLTQAIEKCEFDKDTWVVRGSGADGLAGMLDGFNGLSYNQIESIINSGDANQLKSLIGQRGQSHSFMSTGIVDGKGFGGQVSYKIYLPKGTKAVYAEPQSYWGNTHSHKEIIYKPGDKYSSISHEAEIIIQRGTTYRITDIRYTYGTNIEVTMEVVEQPNYFTTGYEHTFNNGLTSEK